MNLLHFHSALPDTAKPGPTSVVHLLPAGEFKGVDGRGPYRVADAQAIADLSMKAAKGKVVIDENHATDLAHGSGAPARAVGWIVEMHAQQDGIWGKVEWNRTGQQLVADRAYRGISPAFSAPGGTVDRIHRASLTNMPNLPLTHLHSQEPRMDLAELRRRFGLPETATQADIDHSFETARGAVSLHSQVAKAVGLDESASAQALVTGLTAKLVTTGVASAREVELQSQIDSLKKESGQREANRVVDEAARAGRVIPADLRPQLVELHQANPAMATSIINGLPLLASPGLNPRGRVQRPGAGAGDEMAAQIASALELKDPAGFAAALKKAS